MASQDQWQTAQLEIERLQDEKTRLEALIDKGLFAEITRLEAWKQDAEDRLTGQLEYIASQQDEIERVKQERDYHANHHAHHHLLCSAGGNTPCSHETEVERLRAEHAGLEALSIRLGGQLGGQDIALQTQQHEIERLQKEAAGHYQAWQECNRQREQWPNRVERLRTDGEEGAKTLLCQNVEIERLQQERDDADRDVETLQAVVKRQDAEVERLRESYLQYGEMRRVMREEIERLTNALDMVAEEREAWKTRATQLTALLEGKKAEP